MTTKPDMDPELLQRLIAQASQPPVAAVPTAPAVEAARPARRRSKADSNDLAFWLAALALGAALWATGGYFTLAALHALYPPIVAVVGWPWLMDGTALLCWLIPIAVSALEFGSFRRRGLALLVFALVAAFDLGTTSLGLRAWVDNRAVFGVVLSGDLVGSNAGTLLIIGAASLILTFAPEYIVKRGIDTLWALVR